MTDTIRSESNVETVFDDETVLDKRDGIRRPYGEHVAHVWLHPHERPPFPAPPGRPSRSRVAERLVGAAALAASAGVFFLGVEALVRHL
jgi:hypothetical protein